MEEYLPQICWKGEIWFDLVNKLTGKQTLRGIHLDEKHPAGIKNNYQKIMKYFKS
jgi:hypothetical protein